jgi:hypothetical protein
MVITLITTVKRAVRGTGRAKGDAVRGEVRAARPADPVPLAGHLCLTECSAWRPRPPQLLPTLPGVPGAELRRGWLLQTLFRCDISLCGDGISLECREAIVEMRRTGWRIAIVTNDLEAPLQLKSRVAGLSGHRSPTAAAAPVIRRRCRQRVTRLELGIRTERDHLMVGWCLR